MRPLHTVGYNPFTKSQLESRNRIWRRCNGSNFSSKSKGNDNLVAHRVEWDNCKMLHESRARVSAQICKPRMRLTTESANPGCASQVVCACIGPASVRLGLPHDGLRTFHQKSTYQDVINFKALCGTNLVTVPPGRSCSCICPPSVSHFTASRFTEQLCLSLQ